MKLKKEEVDELLLDLNNSKSNDVIYNKKLNECLNKLEFIIDTYTYKYSSFHNYEDLKQDARLALLNAINTYDPEKGGFFGWAKLYIKTKLSRRANKHFVVSIPLKESIDYTPRSVSLDCAFLGNDYFRNGTQKNNTRSHNSFIKSRTNEIKSFESNDCPLQNLLEKEVSKKITNIFNDLSEIEWSILYLNVIKGQTINKISKKLQIPIDKCFLILNSTKTKIREEVMRE